MAEIDNQNLARILGGGSPIFGTPTPNYSIVNTGNPAIDLMLSQLLGDMVGPGKFLPQQFPAQNLLDQAVSAKYGRAAKGMALEMRKGDKAAGIRGDNDALYDMLKGVRNKFDSSELTPLGDAELRNSAEYLNNDFTQNMMGMLIGPQAMEDIFFGQRGSKEMLGKSAATLGFYRPDPVTGHGRMTEKSLKTFTHQIYDNLYGPDADLNDISGFSAGRTGAIMTDLGRRGLLPESMSKLSVAEQRRTIADNKADIAKLGLPEDAMKALATDSPVEELNKLADGAESLRKVDATRVSGALKEYSKAISTVREIFGDSGISDAPMGQLLAAMEALSQNSMSSMAPGKLENLMRRTQMAAKDSGVSLEGLLGLHARAGALAEQNGLPRELAGDNVVLAMERVKALRDTGGFKPGFGRMDPDKAALTMLDQNVKADSSPVARYIAAAQSAIDQGLLNPAAPGGDEQLRALTNAISTGQTMMYDPVTNKQVDIYEELGRNPENFLMPMFEAAGVDRRLLMSLYNDPNTKEALTKMPGRQMHLAQAPELKARMSRQLASSGVIGNAMNSRTGVAMSDKERAELNTELSEAFITAAIDDVNTQMDPEQRITALRESMQGVFVRRNLASGAAADIHEATELANNQMRDVFGGDAGVNQFLGAQYAELGRHTVAVYNTPLPEMQQTRSKRAAYETAQQHRANMMRVNLFDNLRGSGSNPYQRLSDLLLSGDGSAVDHMLDTVNSADVVDKIKGSLKAGDKEGFDATYRELIDMKNTLYVDTKEEREAVLVEAARGYRPARDGDELATVRKQFEGTGAESFIKDKKKYFTTAQVAAEISSKATTDATLSAAASKLYKDTFGETLSFDNAEQMQELAGLQGIDARLRLGLGADALTEADLRAQLELSPVFNPIEDIKKEQMRKRDSALNRYNANLADGNFKSKDILEMMGVDANDTVKKSLDAFLTGGQDAQEEDLRYQLTAFGAEPEQVEKVMQVARTSYAFKKQGGLDSINAKNASEYGELSSKASAIVAALGDSTGKGQKIKADSEIAKLSKKFVAGEAMTEEEKTKLRTTLKDDKALRKVLGDETLRHDVTEDGKTRTKFGDKDAKEKAGDTSREKTADEIIRDAEQREKKLFPEGVSGLGGMGGLGSALASLGSGVATAVKEAFGGEVKIQTASIEKLDLNLSSVASSLMSNVFAAAGTQARDGEIKGTVQIAGDMKTMVVNLFKAASPGVEMPSGFDGAPVRATAAQV